MKTATAYCTDYVKKPNLPYPNAATRRQLLGKFLDLLLVGAIGMGAAAIVLFAMALA